jgi:hypothetical protein
MEVWMQVKNLDADERNTIGLCYNDNNDYGDYHQVVEQDGNEQCYIREHLLSRDWVLVDTEDL